MSFLDDVNRVLDVLERGGIVYADWASILIDLFSQMPKYEQQYTPEVVRKLVDERVAKIEAASIKRDELKATEEDEE